MQISDELRALGYRAFTVDHAPAPFVRATKRQINYATHHPNARSGTAAALNRYWSFKDAVGRCYQNAYPGADMLAGELSLLLVVYWPAGKHRRMDLVNIYKTVEDGLNKVAYPDDVAVTHGRFWIETVDPGLGPSVGVVVGPNS